MKTQILLSFFNYDIYALIFFLGIFVCIYFYKKKKKLPDIPYKIKGENLDYFFDLIYQECEVICIRYIMGSYFVYFECKAENYLINFSDYLMTDNEKMLLKNKKFKLVWNDQSQIIVIPEVPISKSATSSIPVEFVDGFRKIITKTEYVIV